MKKVVFFVTSLNSGGIENYLLRFLTYYEGEIEPIIICKGNVFGELEDEYRKIKHIKIIKIDVGYFNLSAFFNIFNLLKEEKVNSICDFTGNFAGIILFVANLAKVKNRIAFYRGSSNRFKETKLRLIYNNWMLFLVKKNATSILSNSKSAFDFFYKNKSRVDSRFKVVYNGIDAKKFNSKSIIYKKEDFGIPKNAYVVGHTGRYNFAKNHKTILDVAIKICTKYDSIYFVLCGKDTDVYLGDEIASNPILKDKVKVLGYRNDVSSILTLFDLYFFPSITEGQPNSLIEAMISGLPILASNIGPIIETTPEEIHKDLKNPNDVDGYTIAIENFYASNVTNEQNFSNWAVQKFNPDILFNKFFIEL
jgi:glycosyltransferase involved in cell wall biosynthesis